MNHIFSFRALVFAALGFGLAVPAVAQDAPPQTLDLATLPADMVSDVVIPVPGEVFTALDRVGTQPWQEALLDTDRIDLVRPSVSRSETGLTLGLVVANGFLAVQAENREAVKATGEKVLLLSDALGVKDAVLQHCQTIISEADAANWKGVRRELDKVEVSVRGALDDMADEEIAQLISLGGWLGGTDALLQLQQGAYSEDAAELLHQPDLAKVLRERVAELSEDRREEKMVSNVYVALGKIEPLMEEAIPSAESVKALREITSPIVTNLIPKS